MKIFAIKKTKKHKDYYLFGLRILRLSGYSSRQIHDEIQDVFDYVRACADITKMPPARGLMRKRQLGMLKILRVVAKFCKAKNIKFWLDYGTLLGAVRHKGFIPWDDDADIAMLRDDYEQFVDLFNAETPDKDLQAEWYHGGGVYNMIKITHKKVPNIWLDIFPCDLGYKKVSLDEAIQYTAEIKKYIIQNKPKLKHIKDMAQLKQFFIDADKKLEFVGSEADGKPQTMYYGIDSLHEAETIIFDYDMIFPLKNIEFEGEKYPTVNQPERYLTFVYKDYMSLPSKISVHNSGDAFDLRSILALEEYIKDQK